MALRKGDIVTYYSRGHHYEATVKLRHHNGDYRVQATFQLDSKGNHIGTYLGYHYRMNGIDLTLLHKAPRL